MTTILIYILIILICFGISFLLKGFVDKFCKEDEMIEEYKEQNKLRIENADKKEEAIIKKEIKKLKVPYKPKMDIVIFILLAIIECLLYTFVFSKSIELFVVYSFIACILFICAFADIKRCIIPDEVNFVGFLVGIVYSFCKLSFNIKDGIDLILGGLIGFGIFALIYLFSLIVFRKEGMGGGDIKLMGVLGLLLGVANIVQIFVLSFLFASVISIFLLITKIKGKGDYIAFGPFIVLATFVTMFVSGGYTYNQIYRYIMYH